MIVDSTRGLTSGLFLFVKLLSRTTLDEGG
jgi:hypothetical protein